MRTILRKIGNSRGILIPAALLAQCGITGEIELRLEGKTIVIEPARPVRSGWFEGYQADTPDTDAWEGLAPDEDAEEWAW